MEREFLTENVWAVVGVTPDPKKFGFRIYKKLKEHGYTVYAVNPKYSEVGGDATYPDLRALPQKPQVVNFVVNPEIGIKILEACIELGILKIWLQPGTVSVEILKKAAENQIRVVQNCVLAVAFPPRKLL
jgi:predicted CoA-binding protein